MSYLEDLKNSVKALFDAAEDKDTIAKITEINKNIEGVEADTKALKDENAELLKDYKEMIKHSSFKREEDGTRGGGTTLSFEGALQKFMSENKDK